MRPQEIQARAAEAAERGGAVAAAAAAAAVGGEGESSAEFHVGSGGGAGAGTGRRLLRARKRQYFPTAAWPLQREPLPGVWAPPPPEFLHFIASGEMAAAGDVVPHAAALLTAAGTDPAIAAAAAAGHVSALPPLQPPPPPPPPGATPARRTATQPPAVSSSSQPGGTAAAAAASDGGADPYGYPIAAYNANEILQRAALETARLTGQPPPPPPTKYTFMNNRTGPRVGPGLMSQRLLATPPWIFNAKEQHKVARYRTEEMALDLERLQKMDPELKMRMEMPESLSTANQLAAGHMTRRDVPLSDSDSDCDMEGRPLPPGVPHTPMEWRAEGPGHVPAYRRALPPEPPLGPPTLTWDEAVDLAEWAFRLQQRSRPGAVLQL
ncbi:hypothetical protein VOLCADRAFT_89955 [Volvox carteri f. nagariensis]|uniref:Uncharacterized protein n=1 Tax=Volvox carteri f. nagariensis TaxID=3068 RepID=D8TT38_VOLCA|nr:uncharacterized protein VOLCADRAFT_89955 [Volvox carteri f. nagariensis]EFJ49126.1 hypothetical protein VOLCADRAFT_89955 [Volvox carteri f. nagariensis]|eukprot:XP_002949574.1 hypothetical protein VOLCADRAFT_89955 [Volvox carteri f. nagariensis]